MGGCFSKKCCLSTASISLSQGVKASDPTKPMLQLSEPFEEAKHKTEVTAMEEAKPVLHEDNATTNDTIVTKHNRSPERTKKIDSEDDASAVEKSNDLPVASVVRVSSCTKEEVDAILIQCGKLSRIRSNSAAKTRRYSGSKRSFDFDQNKGIHGGSVEEEDAGEDRYRRADRANGSPRERRRRTPSRERGDSGRIYRSGSRERGYSGAGGGSKRVSRSPVKRSERNPNSFGGSERGNSGGGGRKRVSRSPVKRSERNPNSFGGSERGNSGGGGCKRVSRSPVKRSERNPNSFGGSGRSVNFSSIRPGKFVTVPAREKSNNGEPSIKVEPPPSLSRSSSRKAEEPPYRRNPLGEIDQNREIEQTKPNPKTAIGAPSPVNRSRLLRKSRDFDFDFNFKSAEEDVSISLPSCVTKACSIVDAVADLNSKNTNTCRLSSDLKQFVFASTARRADLMEPSFEKYVTLKRGGGGSLEEEQQSCGSISLM